MKTIEEELMRKMQQIQDNECEETESYIRLPSFGIWLIAAAGLLLAAGAAAFLILFS